MQRDLEDLIESVLDGEDLSQQVEELVRLKLKEVLEKLMQAERMALLEEDDGNKGNGFYQRSWQTRFGTIGDLQVPRDRQGAFRTRVFEPYQRREGWLEEMVIRLYTNGVSTREVAKLLEKLYGQHYSAATISRITEISEEAIEGWLNRPLKRRYAVLYLDALVVKLRRDSVANEAIYLVCGVDEEGYREILGFYVGGGESAHVWRDIVEDLKRRGVHQVLLVVCDDLAGLRDQMKQAFPKADVQPCVLHKVRNVLNKVRQKDRWEIARDLRKIYKSPDRESARLHLEGFSTRWKKLYPRIVRDWEECLDELLTFMGYPEELWSVIYTTNWIERVIKEIRKRLRPMNSLPTERAAEKILYLKAVEINDRWNERKLRGFGMAYEQLQRMFTERYPNAQTQLS